MSKSINLDGIIKEAVSALYHQELPSVQIEVSSRLDYGDYSSNVAFVLTKSLSRSPLQIAQELVKEILASSASKNWLEKTEAKDGFVNFFLSSKYLWQNALELMQSSSVWQVDPDLIKQNIMVEYAHPNTHKEMHVGHLRTLLLGESLARMFEAKGAKVFRANYQGDVGPHVAKAIWGVQKLLEEKDLTLEEVDRWPLAQRSHFLGQAYVLGVKDYKDTDIKAKIDALNKEIYGHNPNIEPIYQKTRQWSLDYFESIYRRLGTAFDYLFFESQVADQGKKIVEDNIDSIFERSEGAVVFPGEKYGLHRRVFITSDNNPTYEAKDMDLFLAEYSAFPFDRCIHVVANEQSGYFRVVFEAIKQLIDKDKRFSGLLKDSHRPAKETHLPMGMVNLVGQKMSSRTGVLVTIDELLEQVKDSVKELIKGRSLAIDTQEAIEIIAQAAVKYAYLRVDPKKDLSFDIKSSVNLEGESGPYLQYTYSRIFSLLIKAKDLGFSLENLQIDETEKSYIDNNGEGLRDQSLQEVLHHLLKTNDVLSESLTRLNPSVLANFLFELAQRFNNFYNQVPILPKTKDLKGEKTTPATIAFRLLMVKTVGEVLKRGLGLLGITVLTRM